MNNVTHVFRVQSESPEAVRGIEIAKYSNSEYMVIIDTLWAGDEKPMVTTIKLKADGFQLLLDALLIAAHNIDDYKLPEVS